MVKFFRRPHRRRPSTRRRLAITATDDTAPIALIAETRLAQSEPGKRHTWAWLAAALLHVLVIALLLITWAARPPELAQNPPGVSVVFDNGGAPQAAAPPAPTQAPSELAQTPPPSPLPLPPAPAPALPPPPQVAETQPEVNLNLPQEMPLPAPPTPQLQAVPLPRPAPRMTAKPQPRQKYLVMNDMSLSGGPAAPPTHFQHGLNLDLPQSSASPDSQQVTVHGDVGADWDAELDHWVEEHKYYPQAAAEQGQEGDVRIHFVVDRAGNVTGLRLTDSSGSPFLDQAWLGLFQNAQLPPFPPGTKANTVTIDATMHFELIR